jgi:hypothetical protein
VKDLEGSGRDIIGVLSLNLEGTEENYESVQDSRCFGRDSNQAPPEYESRALLLRLPVRL